MFSLRSDKVHIAGDNDFWDFDMFLHRMALVSFCFHGDGVNVAIFGQHVSKC